MKKTITAVVVAASAVAAPAALAAIDDAGMRYISASEGFGGSLRVKLLSDTSEKDSSIETSLSSTRLYVIGEGDMGSGLTSTYYWEWRVDGKDQSKLVTDSVHVGLKGAFGAFQAGQIEPVGSAMLPSPDLTNDVGIGDQKLNSTSNHQQAMRWISPKINGLQFGVSAGLQNQNLKDDAHEIIDKKVTVETGLGEDVGITFVDPYVDGDDDTIDSFDLAVTYDAPQGFKLGASYESREAYLESVSKNVEVDLGEGPEDEPVGGIPNVEATYGLDNDAAGFRLAGSYGQDNWQIAYNYRAYDHAIADFEVSSRILSKSITGPSGGGTPLTGTDMDIERTLNYLRFIEGEKDTKYTAHSFGGTVAVDKITFGFGYQLENVENKTFAVDLDRKTYSFDVGYSFTSKAKIIAAYSKTDTDEYAIPDVAIVGMVTAVPDKSETYLLYRIDF